MTDHYGIRFFDDLDRYLPALLYDSGQFRTVQDLLAYIQRQAAYYLNQYDRRRESYVRGRGRATPTEVRSLRRGRGGHGGGSRQVSTPSWTRTAPATQPASAQQNSDILNLFASILNPTSTTNSPFQILSTELYDLTPVTVRPTRQQLDSGSQLEGPETRFTIPDGESCAICQDPLRMLDDVSPLRRLRHCSHTFHRTCIDTWFTSHVHCPICRHDIREAGGVAQR